MISSSALTSITSISSRPTRMTRPSLARSNSLASRPCGFPCRPTEKKNAACGFARREAFGKEVSLMAKGDHLLIHMDLFTHHGIDAGDGTVIHWANGNGQGVNPLTKEDAVIQQTSYADFAAGKLVSEW